MKIAEALEEGWNVERGLYFETKPFLEEFKGATDRCFVLDEVSLSYSAQEWYSVQNKIFAALVTSQGFRRNTLILNLPVLQHLDKKVIALAHYILVTYNVGLLKWYKINNFYIMGKVQAQPLSWVNMGLPSQQNIDSYEAMKKKYNDDRLDNDIGTMEIMEHPEKYYGKKLPYDYYLKMFEQQILNENEMKKNLIEAGYKVSDIEKIIDYEKKMNEEERKQQEIDDYIVGHQEKEIEVKKKLSSKQYLQMLRKGIINDEEFEIELQKIGMEEIDIERLKKMIEVEKEKKIEVENRKEENVTVQKLAPELNRLQEDEEYKKKILAEMTAK
jgi:hypothetical protein